MMGVEGLAAGVAMGPEAGTVFERGSNDAPPSFQSLRSRHLAPRTGAGTFSVRYDVPESGCYGAAGRRSRHRWKVYDL